MQLVAVVAASEASHTSKHSVLQQVSKMLTTTQVLYAALRLTVEDVARISLLYPSRWC